MRSRRLTGKRRQASSSSFEAVLAVDRHEQVALLLGRRVQRDRQVRHQRLGREPLERRQHADGRERHAPRRHGQPVLVGEDPQRLHRRVVVVQRLAHAHEDDVEAGREHAELARRARGPGRRSRRRSGCGSIPILPVRQKAHFIAQPTCVEMQKVSGRVGRSAGVVGDEDRLDQLAVVEAQQELGGAVGRLLLARRPRASRCGSAAGELRAQLAAQVAHQREIGDAALVDPLEDLPARENAAARDRSSACSSSGSSTSAMSIRLVIMAHSTERTSVLAGSPALRDRASRVKHVGRRHRSTAACLSTPRGA